MGRQERSEGSLMSGRPRTPGRNHRADQDDAVRRAGRGRHPEPPSQGAVDRQRMVDSRDDGQRRQTSARGATKQAAINALQEKVNSLRGAAVSRPVHSPATADGVISRSSGENTSRISSSAPTVHVKSESGSCAQPYFPSSV